MSQPPQGGPGPHGGQPSEGPGDQGRQGPQGPQGPQAYPPRQAQPPQGYPQQGGPQQGGPQQGGPQPYAQQPYATGPYAPGPYGPPPGQPGHPGQPGQGPKRRTGLFVLIGAGALALLLAVVAIAVNLGGRDDTAGGGTGGTGGGTSSAAPAASASDAVEGYLQAIAAGDAKTAIGYAVDPSTVDTTYMTPAVLAASAKQAPLTDVQVDPSDPDATSVTARYKLGSRAVDSSFDVLKAGDGTWKLVTVASDLDLSSYQLDGVGMLVNGTKVKRGTFSVLPGAYHLTTGQRNFDYGAHPDLVVRHPADYPDTSRIAPQVTSRAKAAALSALRTSWRSCLKSDDPRPSGCPNRWTNSTYKFEDGAVSWDRKGSDPVKKAATTVLGTSIRYQVKVDVTLKGRCTINGQPATCSGSLEGIAPAVATVSATRVTLRWLR